MRLKEQNDVDEEWTLQVISQIEKYESERDRMVTEIYYGHDTDLALDNSSGGQSAVTASYSIRSLINYYSSRNFVVKEMSPEKFEEYFNHKNWDSFSNEQLVFVDDVVYLCCY
jgi:hypothetical protein